jgi:hypothetical protein
LNAEGESSIKRAINTPTPDTVGQPFMDAATIAGPAIPALRSGSGPLGGSFAPSGFVPTIPRPVPFSSDIASVAQPLGGVMKRASYGMYNNVLGTKGADLAYEGNPGRGVAQEGIVAGSRKALLEKINEKLSIRGPQIEEVLNLPQNAGLRLDLAKAINSPLDEAISTGRQGVTPDATLSRLTQTQRELTMERDAGTGEYTGQPKNLSRMSPLEANRMKRGIQDRANYDNPEYDEAVNNTLRQAARGAKEQVNTAVPEVAPFNQRVADLSGARDALSLRVSRRLSNPPSTGFKDVAPAVGGLVIGGPKAAAVGVVGRNVLTSVPFKTATAQGLYRIGDVFSREPALRVPAATQPPHVTIAGLLPPAPAQLRPSMDPLSEPTPIATPAGFNTTRAQRLGLLLNEPPKQIPGLGYTSQTDAEGQIEHESPIAQPAASVVQRGKDGQMKRIFFTSTKEGQR